MSTELDLSLYLVTDHTQTDAAMRESVTAAVAGGVTAVQLREPERSDGDVYRIARDLVELLAGTGVRLVVNDRVDVALAAGASGVHLGQGDLPPQRVREVAGAGFVIGWTVGTADEVAAAHALPDGTLDYLGISPVLDTPTKPDAAAALGVGGLRRLRRMSTLPCVAIGGVSARNATEIKATGVEGVAVVSAICAAEDPRAAAAELRRCLA